MSSQPRPSPRAADLTRRGYIFRSTLFNWGGHLVYVIAGFIIPRFVDRRLGAELLGVWDFGWSLVGYIDLMMLGLVSAVNRFVARHRERNETEELNRCVNSSLVVMAASTLLALGLTVVFVLATPQLLGGLSPAAEHQARMMMLLLGISGAVQLPSGIFNGVVTGCARFGLKNVIRSGAHALAVVGMIAVVWQGYGLIALAAVCLAEQILTAVLFAAASFRLCPELTLAARYCRLETVRTLVAFSGKALAASIGRSVLYQTNAILLAWYLGPVALAVFSRQRALVLHGVRFATQFGHAFLPASSVLEARGDRAALASLMIDSARCGLAMALPMVIFLTLLGTPLMEVWMGPAYVSPAVLVILALGHLFSMAHRGTYAALAGMNRHSVPAFSEVAGALFGVALGVTLMGPLKLGMIGAAVSVVVPVTWAGGMMVVREAGRALNVPLGALLWQTSARPLAAAAPFGLCCLMVRLALFDQPLYALLAGGLAGGAVLAATYWYVLLSPAIRGRILNRFVPSLA